MHKLVQQVALAAVVFWGPFSAAQAQQTNAVLEEVALIIPSVMTQVNAFAQVQKNTQLSADAAIDLTTINDTAELGERLQDIQTYVGAATDMIAVLRAAPALAALEARDNGLNEANQTSAFELMTNSLEDAGATEIVRKMQSERRYFQAWSDLLNILRDNPDMWSPEDSNNFPIRFMTAEFEAVVWTWIDIILLTEKNTNQKANELDAVRSTEN